MSLLGLKDNLDGLAKATGVRWYGHVLRRVNGDVLKRAFLKWRKEAAKYDVEEKSGGAYQSDRTEKEGCH